MKNMIAVPAMALLLGACAVTEPVQRAVKAAPPTLESQMADAERAAAGGQHDKAMATLRSAASSYPSEKAPLLQMAQLQFERGSYGEAISHALDALQRDPADRQGNSIVAVAGLRLSTKALADLSLQNNLGGNVRSEAQELANLLRSSLGEDVLVPQGARPKAAPQRKLPVASGAPARKAAPGADPFSALK